MLLSNNKRIINKNRSVRKNFALRKRNNLIHRVTICKMLKLEHFDFNLFHVILVAKCKSLFAL